MRRLPFALRNVGRSAGRGLRVAMATPAIGRRRTASCLRTALFLFLITFVWLQLHVASLNGNRSSSMGGDTPEGNDSAAAILSMVPQIPSGEEELQLPIITEVQRQQLEEQVTLENIQVLHKFLTPRPRNNTAASSSSNASSDSAGVLPPANISEIRRNIERYNELQTVLNEDVFGPVQNDSLLIVVQVHTRIIYLRHLIVSLAQAKDIDSVLLIFSHDYYDEEINELVQSVDFCKVMQIFYPYSIQTHPHEFPGESPGDCPRNIKKEQAREMMCNNALYPDLYGHYREAKFTQTKHHWWWKANRVFNQLEVTRNHTGMVLFLEEDHYVAEDFIHILRLMERTCKTSCEKCNILSLGTYLKTYNYYGDSKKAEVTPWVSSKHNMGMAFNRSTWQEIRQCADFFCTYDDYNWDWSLQHISQGCMQHKLHAMVMKGPRVFHIGECGVHHKKNNCESTAVISKVQHVLKYASKHLYPSHLQLTVTNGNKKNKLRKGNGGWGDLRDHQLCMNMTRVGR